MNFVKFLRTPFLQNTSGRLVLFRFNQFTTDTSREKAPSNKTPALSKSMNINIWLVDISDQLVLRVSTTTKIKFSKKESSYWQNSVLCDRSIFYVFFAETFKFIKNEALAQVLSCEFGEIFKNTFLQNTFGRSFCNSLNTKVATI